MKLSNDKYSLLELNIKTNENSFPKKKGKLFNGKVGIGVALVLTSMSLSITGCSKTNDIDFKTAASFEEESGYNIDRSSFEYLEQIEVVQNIIDSIESTNDKEELSILYQELNNNAHILESNAIGLAHYKIAEAMNTNENDVEISRDTTDAPTWIARVGNDLLIGNDLGNPLNNYLNEVGTLQSWKRDGKYQVTEYKEFLERCNKTIAAMAEMSIYDLDLNNKGKLVANVSKLNEDEIKKSSIK
ncbi:MAG: hypothetical protein PHQ64_03405 [Bacilli bacterium]|nr:hypothetical protein [Bacilli bacterium]